MPTTSHETTERPGRRHAAEAEREDRERRPEQEERVDAEETAALLAIGRLDLEAAAAYEIAAQAVDEESLRRMLMSFGDDHRRHVEDLVALARARGTEVETPPPPDLRTSSFVALATSLGDLDPDAAVEGIIANEGLTNATYETALWLVTEDEALALVRRNREDERRHLESLTAWMAKHG